MIYHFFIDEKFVDDFISDARKVSENQKFIVTSSAPLKFVHEANILHFEYHSAELKKLAQGIKESDRVCIHWYSPKLKSTLELIPSKTEIFLMFWGADFLQNRHPPGKNDQLEKFNFDELTLKYIREKQQLNFHKKTSSFTSANKFSVFKNALSIVKQYRYKKKWENGEDFKKDWNEKRKFLLRIKAICHWNPYDIEFLEDYYQVKLNQCFFVYSVGANDLYQTNFVQDKTVLWLGNSDTPTNNHLDAFESLKKFKNQKIEIICPLNYGDKKYGDLVERKGQEIFGDKFIALRNYLDRDSYYNLMNRVSIALMFHNRGQAGGNIVAFIKKGVKIYLKDQSSISRFLQYQGIEVHSANRIKDLNFDEFSSPLNEKTIQRNIDIINDCLTNEEKRIQALEKLLKT
ncbi:MAG: TDP-N-acetylfucosamine:lipid II N-acetylfucosaminyltransferase [Crocinitomicaceae bacterium]|jgi:hypothetical protein|nr:TDP-N-acetylfucosamine:lipid II N-acetylfucosaminyltransferase [Crocinitomicaceae bacterium]